jgi:cytochrome c556
VQHVEAKRNLTMRLFERLIGRVRSKTISVVLAASLLGLGGHLYAQTSSDFMPQITIIELMDSIVMPAAQVVWDAVTYDVTAAGESVTGPKTDEDWQKLRWSAVALAESANNLVVPGRAANHPGAKAGEGELAPEEIDKLIASNRAAWIGHAHVLYEAAMEAVRAIDAKNAEQVSDAGGTIDAACEACHLQFWYPNQ